MGIDSEFLIHLQDLATRGEVRVSEHGYDELAADGLFAIEVIDGLAGAAIIEHYPDFPKGSCALV
ncbi:MAG: hypothetical protein WBD51_21380, partial [Burkholderiaceae bacterium]